MGKVFRGRRFSPSEESAAGGWREFLLLTHQHSFVEPREAIGENLLLVEFAESSAHVSCLRRASIHTRPQRPQRGPRAGRPHSRATTTTPFFCVPHRHTKHAKPESRSRAPPAQRTFAPE